MEDIQRNNHLLSSCGKIIAFNCKRAAADDETSELIFSRHSFERENNRFVKEADGAAVISRKGAAHLDVVRCQCAVDVQKRLATVFVLVVRKVGKGESYQYRLLTLSSSNQLDACVEFKVPHQIKDNVCILQGPTVLWSHAGDVFYTQAGEVKKVPIELSSCVVGKPCSLRGQVFVLGLQTFSKQLPENQSRTLGYFVEDGQVFDGDMLLPQPYIFITRRILVLSADKEGGVLKSAVVAATSNQQLVYFVNGMVKDVCQLPFTQPEDIQVVDTGRNGCLFVIFFNQGHVCAIWKETFQMASQWSGVSSVHVGDFLGCGTDQILLAFKDEGVTGQLLDHFLLTDLCGVSYSRGQDMGELPKSPSLPENCLFTLEALNSRLQSGVNVLQELQREVRVKERVVQESFQALTDAVSGRDAVLTQPEQEGLVALWECEDDECDDKMQDMPAVPSRPQVDELWHRITEDQLVVGVILTTDSSSRPLASVSLSILTETGQSSTPAVIQTQSQVLWLPAPCPSSSSSSSSSAPTFSEPAAKKSKRHDAGRLGDLDARRLAVTAVTRLTPLLNSGCVKCCVMLHYMQRQDADSLVSNPTPVALHCGQVVLDIHGDFPNQLLNHPDLKTDGVKEDLLSLMALLDRWVFHIESPDHSLGDVDGWIQKRAGSKRMDVWPQYRLVNSSGPSARMLLHWHQTTPFQGELTVHSNQLQMLQFLESLLVHLPGSCAVQPVKAPRQQGAAQIFALAIEKEVASLRDCVSLLLCEKDEEKRKGLERDDAPNPGSAEELRRCRDSWQQDAESSRMRLSPALNLGRYRGLVQSVSTEQLCGDLAAVLESQRALLS